MKQICFFLLSLIVVHSVEVKAGKNNILTLEKVKSLVLTASLEEGRPAHISAASGIVKKQDTFFVVSDDENSLFSFTEKSPLTTLPLNPLVLPVEPKARKKVKSDFESILLLSAVDLQPFGGILAMPSGSELNRQKASLIPFTDKSGKMGAAQVIDLAPLFGALRAETKNLNIEGLVIHKGILHLFQRGNGQKGKNGVFEIPTKELITLLEKKKWHPEALHFRPLKTGKLAKVKLTITDAASSKSGILLLAAAEDTSDTYTDGEIKGSVLAILEDVVKGTDDFKILGRLASDIKMEGLFVDSSGKEEIVYLVDDADDPHKPSHLYKLKLNSILSE